MSEARFRITYKPEGAPERTWEVDVMSGLKASEMIALKRASDGAVPSVSVMLNGIAELDMEAIKGLLWVLLKRDLSTVPWGGLDFTLDELDVEPLSNLTPGQERAKLEDAKAAGNLSPAGEKHLEKLIADGVEPEREAPDPKA